MTVPTLFQLPLFVFCYYSLSGYQLSFTQRDSSSAHHQLKTTAPLPPDFFCFSIPGLFYSIATGASLLLFFLIIPRLLPTYSPSTFTPLFYASSRLSVHQLLAFRDQPNAQSRASH